MVKIFALKKKGSLLKSLLAVALLVLAVVLIGGLDGCRRDIKTVVVEGGSMTGVFTNGDDIRVDYGYYKCHAVGRGDFAVLDVGVQNKDIVKIVQAIPGDTWSVEKQSDSSFAVRVNGQLLRNYSGLLYSFNENSAKMLQSYAKGYKGVIPKEAVLVFGNQPGGSFDSSVFGLTGFRSLRGKVLSKPSVVKH